MTPNPTNAFISLFYHISFVKSIFEFLSKKFHIKENPRGFLQVGSILYKDVKLLVDWDIFHQKEVLPSEVLNPCLNKDNLPSGIEESKSLYLAISTIF